MKVAVLGAGSWGTALAMVLAGNGHDVTIWARNNDFVEELRSSGKNQKYLPNIELHESLKFTSNIKESVEGAKVVVYASASQAFRQVISQIQGEIHADTVITNVSKGIENETLMLSSEIAAQLFPNNKFVVLSGPSHAEEVASNNPTTLVSASRDILAAELVQDIFITDTLRVYTNPDVVGVELGGSLKNIIALGAGISDGMGFGDNAKAALMTRGVTEITRLGLALGASFNTFQGLTGIGDLIVTCTSMHSRNRRCGIEIGKGVKVQDAIDSIGMVVEGIYAVKAAYDLSIKHKIEMPITLELYHILYENYNARESVKNLMMRKRKHEMEEL